jgi:hypothetical protein
MTLRSPPGSYQTAVVSLPSPGALGPLCSGPTAVDFPHRCKLITMPLPSRPDGFTSKVHEGGLDVRSRDAGKELGHQDALRRSSHHRSRPVPTQKHTAVRGLPRSLQGLHQAPLSTPGDVVCYLARSQSAPISLISLCPLPIVATDLPLILPARPYLS